MLLGEEEKEGRKSAAWKEIFFLLAFSGLFSHDTVQQQQSVRIHK
jgi:hypothetical protein